MITNKKSNEVIGFLHHQKELSSCVTELRSAGFSASDFSTHIANPELERPVTPIGRVKKTTGAESGVAGAGIGAALGSMLGLLFGSGYLDFFDSSVSGSLSPYLSVGVGAAVGAAFGGVGGVFVGHKIPDNEEGFERIAPDEIRISVLTENEAQIQLAKFILAEFGATHITTKYREASSPFLYQQKKRSKKSSKSSYTLDQHH